MPIYDVQAPDGKVYSVEAPEGTSEDQIFSFVRGQMGQFNAPKPQEGIGAALAGGFKRFLSSGETALESIIDHHEGNAGESVHRFDATTIDDRQPGKLLEVKPVNRVGR
ncbi:hypothetical protein EBX93_15365 [bacterium]|nr:hypothetical protein [bacterium]